MTTQDLLFETFLHLPEKQIFEIKTASAEEFPISVKSHNNEISNFIFDESLNKISYEIPFDWNDHSHSSSINQIISLNKDFSSISKDHDLLISLNEVEIDKEFYEFDVSNPDKNSIKIDLPP